MIDLKKFTSLAALMLMSFLWVGCGGSSNGNSTISFTVDDITPTSQKKLSESGDNISEINVVDLEGNDIGIVTHVKLRTYTVVLKSGVPFIIQAIIKNGNNGEFGLEAFIEKAKDGNIEVDQDSTEISIIIRERATQSQQHIKDFVDEHEGEVGNVTTEISDILNREFINNALENLSDADSLKDIAEKLASIIRRLEKITDIIERIQNNIEKFNEGSEETFFYYNFYETDGRHLTTEELANHLGGAQDGETGEEKEFEIEIGENGDVAVINGDEAEHIQTSLESSSVVKGEILGVNDDLIVLGVRTDNGLKESRFTNPGTNPLISEILASLHIGEQITVKFEADGDNKIIVNIFGRGITTGIVVEKGEGFIVVEDAAGNHTKFTPQWINSDTENLDVVTDEVITSDENSTTDAAKKGKGQLDPEMISFIEHLSVGDKVSVIWEIDERKRIIKISQIDKLIIDEGGETVDEESPAESTITETAGKILEKGEGFFIFSGNTQEANAAPEITKITINKEIAHQQEILDALHANDEVTISFTTKEEINLLVSIKGEGSFTGSVIEKTDSAIYVKDAEGHTIKFTPLWVKTEATLADSEFGGFDPEMLELFASLELESTITVKWLLEERKRAVEIVKE